MTKTLSAPCLLLLLPLVLSLACSESKDDKAEPDASDEVDAGSEQDAAPEDAGEDAGEECTETSQNETRETAEKIALDETIEGCIASKDDVDFFEVTTPADPTRRGGYITIELDVSADIGLSVKTFAAADDGMIVADSGAVGESKVLWFAAAHDATYRFSLSRFVGKGADYAVRVSFVSLPQAANEVAELAVPLELGTPTEVYVFAPHLKSVPSQDGEDAWYTVMLAEGSVQIEASDVPDEGVLLAELFAAGPSGDKGAVVAKSRSAGSGAAFGIGPQAVKAGLHFIRLFNLSAPAQKGEGEIGAQLRKPLTLKVTQ